MKPKKQGVVPDWTLVFSPRGALKIRRCFVLDSWIVHALEVFDLWIVLAWSFKNKELFQMDLCTVPA